MKFSSCARIKEGSSCMMKRRNISSMCALPQFQKYVWTAHTTPLHCWPLLSNICRDLVKVIFSDTRVHPWSFHADWQSSRRRSCSPMFLIWIIGLQINQAGRPRLDRTDAMSISKRQNRTYARDAYWLVKNSESRRRVLALMVDDNETSPCTYPRPSHNV